jgi:hypothetical protein
MHDMHSRDPLTCTPICRVHIRIRSLARPIGPAGDVFYAPFRISSGRVVGFGAEKRIVGGADMAVMHADENLIHNGVCVVADPKGSTILWYDGTSQGEEGAYDGLLDGIVPANLRSRLCVRIASTNPGWRSLNRNPLLAAGSFKWAAGSLEFVILSLAENGALN